MSRKKDNPALVASNGDPRPYDGPIRDINGKRPYNGYLYPTDWYWAKNDFKHLQYPDRIHPMWKFGITALEDGRFAVDGMIWHIERNERHWSWDGPPAGRLPRRNNFPTRIAAIRASAADFIRLCRAARRWAPDVWYQPLTFVTIDELIEWARDIVAYEEHRLTQGATEHAEE